VTGPSTSRQRTRLARLRTASGFVVLGVLLLRQGVSRGTTADLVAAALALGCALALARAPVVPPAPRTRPTAVGGTRLPARTLTLAVLAISCLALAGALTGRP
jgi:drug/metabolite transporter (DMT)-like permease